MADKDLTVSCILSGLRLDLHAVVFSVLGINTTDDKKETKIMDWSGGLVGDTFRGDAALSDL